MANRDNFRNRAAAYAARFDSDGTGKWLPLVFGEQKLTPESGFKPQAEVLIDARRAADLLGATRMDRPKDVQPNGSNGKVYVILTNNDKRKDDQVDKANPRAENLFGHIIELEPRGGDHADDSFTWEILVRCGNPRDPRGGVDALWNPATSVNGWFACPDNACVDDEGRLWMATDQGDNWPRTGRADGLYGLETESDRRGTSKLFYRVPVGAELCGPCFTPDRETLFVAVQHPAADGAEALYGSAGRRPTRTRQRAGQTSGRIDRRGHRSWSSPRSAAARSPKGRAPLKLPLMRAS
jgi:secreted PhoX family phosphatase